MLMPRIFGESFLDDFFGTPQKPVHNVYYTNKLMQTDIRETAEGYEVAMDLPGFRKEEVGAELKDGYLTVTAQTKQDNDKKDADGKYIRRERYSGTCSRSFYVGEEITQEDIKAKFENGVLKLFVPKKEARPVVEESRRIMIEG